jgi:hypothetical protein
MDGWVWDIGTNVFHTLAHPVALTHGYKRIKTIHGNFICIRRSIQILKKSHLILETKPLSKSGTGTENKAILQIPSTISLWT